MIKGQMAMDKGIKLLSLNCRGLNNVNEMKKLFQWFNDNKYDIICLQETYCTDKLKPVFDTCWDGKAVHATTDSPHSRGVSILFSKRLSCEIINTHASQDGRKVIANIKLESEDSKCISIISIYAPNVEKNRKDFFKNMSKWIMKYSVSSDQLIVCGDHNCCLNDEDRIPNTHLKDSSRFAMKHMMKYCKLQDIWHMYKEGKMNRFTYIDKKTKTKSRLDYILVSEKCFVRHHDINLIKAIKGDHKAVCVNLVYDVKRKGPGYWKLNSSILEQQEYQKGVKDIIRTSQTQFENMRSKRLVWEIIKINVKEYSIQYCKRIRKNAHKKEVELQHEINRLEETIGGVKNNDPQMQLLLDEKGEKEIMLNEIYDQKVKGCQIRSRAKWVEQGEKSNKFFLGLEKQRQNHNVIERLCTGSGNIVSSENDILIEIDNFYNKLYTSVNVNVVEINSYLENINIKTLSDKERQQCDQEISIQEICNAIDNLKENKSPGLDGLTPEFYKIFKEDIIQSLYEMIVESYKEGELPDSLRKAVVTLIFKKGDTKKLNNYRPISLTNYDYKILAFILATRMQSVLSNIVNENQTAYIKNRFIGTNARLVQDIFEFCENKNKSGIILGLDFEKAFDTLEWSFMLKALKKFNFGERFINWIKILYTSPSMIFKNNGWLSCELKPTRGIRQGCPVSALLFIISVEILAQQIRDNKNINGICINQNEHKISQYADDSYLLLHDIESITESVRTINMFSRLAGPRLNMKKTEGIWLGPYKHFPKTACGITFTDNPVRCLGIYIGHDKVKCFEKNWIEKLEKIEKILEIWNRRQLSLHGKVVIVKTLIMSKLVYNFSLLPTPEGIIHKIDKILFKFIWHRRERIKRNTIIANVEDGGISMVDTSCKNMSVKAAWVKRLLNGGAWTNVFRAYLDECCIDLDYLIKINVKKKDDCNIFQYLPPFYCEIFLSFNACKPNKQSSLLNTYDYLSSTIMGNDLIRNKGKCIYLKSWLESGIKYVKDLYDENGNFLSEARLLQILKRKTNWIAEYSCIKQAVKKYNNIFNTEMALYTNISATRHIVYKNKIYNIDTLNSKIFYEILLQRKTNRSHMETIWCKEFGIINHVHIWTDIYLRNVKLFPIKKIAEFKYKILHNTLYTGYIVNKWDKTCSANCTYCGKLETPKHLLYDCKRIQSLWKKVGDMLGINILWRNIVIGREEMNMYAKVINICISIVAYSIYSIWVKCSMSELKYETIEFNNSVLTRLIFYCKVLEKTNVYSELGKKILECIHKA